MKPSVTPKKSIGQLLDVSELSPEQIDQAFSIYHEYYADVNAETFRNDLIKKDKIAILIDPTTKTVRGFSTLQIKQITHEQKKHTVFFSGDTIVEEAYRGTTTLTATVLKFVFLEKLRRPMQPFWWFLISKGYKTYLVLTNNFVNYFPAYDKPTSSSQSRLLASVVEQFYSDQCQFEQGILTFPGRTERLKPSTAPVNDALMKSNPNINFFIQKNPNWSEGHELACLGRIDSALFLKYTKKFLAKNFKKSTRSRPKTLANTGGTSS